jgi:hypothetical protein
MGVDRVCKRGSLDPPSRGGRGVSEIQPAEEGARNLDSKISRGTGLLNK